MSFADKKGITVASGFKLQAGSLLDAREQVDTLAERDELVRINAVTEGLTVYVKDTKTLYVYNGEGWDELSKGQGYVHPDSPGYKHIPAGGTVGQVLKNKAAGEAEWATLSASDVSAIPASEKGNANGVASLDETGKVPAAQLPSYVDDILEFDNQTAFPKTGESGKIYVAIDTGLTFRWSGSAYVEISASLALGETASTAFAGDKGKKAYDHSQAAHAPANAQKNVQADWNEASTESDAFIKNKPTSLPANGGNADTVGGHTVDKDVPANAEFITAADKERWDNKPEIYFAHELPSDAPAGSICYVI